MDSDYFSKIASPSSFPDDNEANLSLESDNSLDTEMPFSFYLKCKDSPASANMSVSDITKVKARNQKSAAAPKQGKCLQQQRTPRTIKRIMETHRQNERNRHHLLNQKMNLLCQIVPGSLSADKETKVVMMQRIISYVAYLENTVGTISVMLGVAHDKSLSLLLPAFQQYACGGAKSLGCGRRRHKAKPRRHRPRTTTTISGCSTDGDIGEVLSHADATTDRVVPEMDSQNSSLTDRNVPDVDSSQTSGMGDGDVLESGSKTETRLLSPCSSRTDSSSACASPSSLGLAPVSGASSLPTWFFEEFNPLEDLKFDLLEGSDADSDIFPLGSSDRWDGFRLTPKKELGFLDTATSSVRKRDHYSSRPSAPEGRNWRVKLENIVEEIGMDPKKNVEPNSENLLQTPKKISCSEHEPATPISTAMKQTQTESPSSNSPSSSQQTYSPDGRIVKKKARQRKYTNVRTPLVNLTNKNRGRGRKQLPKGSSPSQSYRKLRANVHQKEDAAFVRDLPFRTAQMKMAAVRQQRVQNARRNGKDDLEVEPVVEKVKKYKPPKIDHRKASWMNGFMMFSRLNRRQFIESNPGIHTSHISKMMGHHWKQMSKEEQLPFNLKAKMFALQMEKALRVPDDLAFHDEAHGTEQQPASSRGANSLFSRIHSSIKVENAQS